MANLYDLAIFDLPNFNIMVFFLERYEDNQGFGIPSSEGDQKGKDWASVAILATFLNLAGSQSGIDRELM